MAKNAYNQSSANYEAINKIKFNVDKIANNKGAILVKTNFSVISNTKDKLFDLPFTIPDGVMAIIITCALNSSQPYTVKINTNGENKIFQLNTNPASIVICDEDYIAQMALTLMQGSGTNEVCSALITTPQMGGTTLSLELNAGQVIGGDGKISAYIIDK